MDQARLAQAADGFVRSFSPSRFISVPHLDYSWGYIRLVWVIGLVFSLNYLRSFRQKGKCSEMLLPAKVTGSETYHVNETIACSPGVDSPRESNLVYVSRSL